MRSKMTTRLRSILRPETHDPKLKSVNFASTLFEEKKFLKDVPVHDKDLADIICKIPVFPEQSTLFPTEEDDVCKTNTSRQFSDNFIKTTLSQVKPYDFVKVIVMSAISTILGKTHRFEDEGYFALLYHLNQERNVIIESKSNEGVGIAVKFYQINNGRYTFNINNKKIKNRGTMVQLDFRDDPFTEDETEDIIREIDKLKFVQQAKINLEIWDEDEPVDEYVVNEDFAQNEDEITIIVSQNLDSTEQITFRDTGLGVSKQDFINYSLVPYATVSSKLRDSSMKIIREETEKQVDFVDITGVYDYFEGFYVVVGNFVKYECEADIGFVIFFETEAEYNDEQLFFKRTTKLVSEQKTNVFKCLVNLSTFDPNKKIIVQEIIQDSLNFGEPVVPTELASYFDAYEAMYIPEIVPYAPTVSQVQSLDEVPVGIPDMFAPLADAYGKTKLQRNLSTLIVQKGISDPKLFFDFLEKFRFAVTNKLHFIRKNTYLRYVYWHLSKCDQAELALPNWFNFEFSENKKLSKKVYSFLYHSQLELARYAQYGRLFLPFTPEVSKPEKILKDIAAREIYHPFEIYVNFCFTAAGHGTMLKSFYKKDFDLLQDVFAYKSSFMQYLAPMLEKVTLSYVPLSEKGKTYQITAKQFMVAVANGHTEISFEKISQITTNNTSKLFTNLLEKRDKTPFEILEVLFRTFSGDVIDVTIQRDFISFYTPETKAVDFGLFLPYFENSLFFLYGTHKVYVERSDEKSQLFITVNSGLVYEISEKNAPGKEIGTQITIFLPGISFLREIKKYYGIVEALYVNEKRVNFNIPKVYEDEYGNKVFYDATSGFPSFVFQGKRPKYKLNIPAEEFQKKLVLSQGFIFEIVNETLPESLIDIGFVHAVARSLVKREPGVILEMSNYFLSSKEFLDALHTASSSYAQILRSDKIEL